MTVTSVHHDPDALTLSIRAEFDEPVAAVWDLWNDPRKLERWWGPPTWPATFVRHELAPGGEISYFMTGPDGDTSHGWWKVLVVEPPHHLEFHNGLADESGAPLADTPFMLMNVDLREEPPHHTTMDVVTIFPSVLAMEKFLGMGMAEGMAGALSQIDDLL